jgi:hypothetical protein
MGTDERLIEDPAPADTPPHPASGQLPYPALSEAEQSRGLSRVDLMRPC